MLTVCLSVISKIISNVPADSLVRTERPPNKEILRYFIRHYALRAGTCENAPWVVEDELVKKYSLPSKFSDFLLDPHKVRIPESTSVAFSPVPTLKQSWQRLQCAGWVLVLPSLHQLRGVQSRKAHSSADWPFGRWLTGCPGRLWSLLLWRYSRPAWTRSCAACSRWPCFSRGVGLDDPQRSLPTPSILWFCG